MIDFSKIVKYKTISLFTFSTVLTNIASILSGFFLLKWIRPEELGIWNSVTIIEVYTVIFRFGIVNGLSRELPYAIGKGDKVASKQILETTLFWSMANTALFFAATIGYAIFSSGSIYKPAMIIEGIIVTLSFYLAYLNVTFRSNQDFLSLSYRQIILAVLKVASIYLIFKLGFNGLLIRELAFSLISIIILHSIRPFKVMPIFHRERIVLLMKTGIPLFSASYLMSMIQSIPRMILISFGTIRDVGLYSPVLSLLQSFSVLGDSFNQYFYPKMVYYLGKGGGIADNYKRSVKIQLLLTVISMPISIVLYLILPYVLVRFFPQYNNSLVILRIISVFGIFISFKFSHTFLATYKSWGGLFLQIGLFAASQSIFPMILKDRMPLIEAVVWSQGLSYAVLFVVSILITRYVARTYATQN